ncbi:MAG: hypothetical protein ACRDA4_07710 [Filifactoraceae bacterium]
MEIYSYLESVEKIEKGKDYFNNVKRYIIEIDEINEMILPKNYKGMFGVLRMAQKYLKENLKKNPREYYLIPKIFKKGIHCIYIEKSQLRKLISLLKSINLDWVSPLYFAMELIDEKEFSNGKVLFNIGEYIYRLDVEDGCVCSQQSYLKEGYYSYDLKNNNFFKKSIIWLEGESHEFIEKNKEN